MDPDTALAELRAAIVAVRDALEGNGDLIDSADALAASAEALDEWMGKGGFLPEPWALYRTGGRTP